MALDVENRKLRGVMREHKQGVPFYAALGVAATCFGIAVIANDLTLQVALVCFGVTLLALAMNKKRQLRKAAAQRGLDRKQMAVVEDAVAKLVSYDTDSAFLTDHDGDIKYANPAALEVFGEAAETDLISAFSQVLANPDSVLFRLQNHALTVGAAKEDVVTRTGHFRLSVVKAGSEMQLWRMETVENSGRETPRPLDALALPMMTAGPSGAVLYVNEAMRKFLGVRPKSLADIFETIPQRSGERHVVGSVEGPEEKIVAIVKGVAGRREVYFLPNEIDAAENSQVAGAGWDAIEDLPVPLMKIAPDGKISASNREARQLFGLESTDGRSMADILDGLGRPMSQWLNEALTGRSTNDSQFLRGRGARAETFVQVVLNRATGPEGPHLIAVINDVTELKSLEAQFVQSQKMQAIGQLAGGVAHDFNNLLTAISGHCDLLLLRHDEGDGDYADLIQIHQNANRAAGLVGQLLAFSRKQNLQPEEIDLRDTLAELTHLLNRLVGEKVTLTLDHAADLAAVRADKRQLEQVLMNLVVNARDAMPDGGDISIKTSNVTLTEELTRDRAIVSPGDYVVVRVKDQGTGIPPDVMPKIFDPFFSTKRTGEGTGLGLSTVYGIIKQTGGFIFADTEQGQGTEFQIYLPAHRLPVAEDLPQVIERKEPLPLTGDGVVLLVEDEAPVRAFASRALRLRGYTVLEADSAETALDMLDDDSLSVDIFVTDVIMPGKDGPTWVREALENRPETKVVFVSGYAEDAFAEGQDEIPNSVFLPKPFSLTQLTTTVQGQLH